MSLNLTSQATPSSPLKKAIQCLRATVVSVVLSNCTPVDEHLDPSQGNYCGGTEEVPHFIHNGDYCGG